MGACKYLTCEQKKASYISIGIAKFESRGIYDIANFNGGGPSMLNKRSVLKLNSQPVPFVTSNRVSLIFVYVVNTAVAG